MTIAEMIERLNFERHKIDDEFARIDNKFTKMRDDFGKEIGRAKEKSAYLGAAVAILLNECSQNSNDSQLSSEAHRKIMEWLDKPNSF